MRNRTWRALTMFAASTALLVGSASLAPAAIVERDRYSFTDSFAGEECGLAVEVDVESSGLLMIRKDRPGSTAFLLSNVFTYREVVTNPDTGNWLVFRGNGNFREVTATHVEGDIYQIRAQLAGQHFVIENSDGDVVYRDRGLLVFDVLFDTLGDDTPGGEEISFELVEMRGHPGFIDDLCPLIHELLG